MGMLPAIGSALATVGKTAVKAAETKVNKKLGTSFGTSKPAPAATSMSQGAPSPGNSPRRNSARSGTSSEYSGITSANELSDM